VDSRFSRNDRSEYSPKSSAVTPAEAGVQRGQCQTRVFIQTLQPALWGLGDLPRTHPTACLGVRSFGVRQLAAAFLPASLLARISTWSTIPCQQAGFSQSGSKLPHSKAPLRMPGGKRFSLTCKAPPFRQPRLIHIFNNALRVSTSSIVLTIILRKSPLGSSESKTSRISCGVR